MKEENTIHTHYQSIKEKFEKKFTKTSMWQLVPDTPRKIMAEDKEVAKFMVDISSFLQSALTGQLEGVKNTIEEMRKECQMCSNFPSSDVGHDLHIHTHNKALSDLLLTLKQEKELIEKN